MFWQQNGTRKTAKNDLQKYLRKYENGGGKRGAGSATKVVRSLTIFNTVLALGAIVAN